MAVTDINLPLILRNELATKTATTVTKNVIKTIHFEVSGIIIIIIIIIIIKSDSLCYVIRFRHFLGEFAKLRKATVSFVTSVRMEQLGSHSADFREILYLIIFRKICLENPSFTKIEQEQPALYMKTNTHFLLYRAHFFLE